MHCALHELLLGGGPFIVLQSCGISQIYHTYEEDMHPIYPLLLWLFRGVAKEYVTTVAEDILGTCPPSILV